MFEGESSDGAGYAHVSRCFRTVFPEGHVPILAHNVLLNEVYREGNVISIFYDLTVGLDVDIYNRHAWVGALRQARGTVVVAMYSDLEGSLFPCLMFRNAPERHIWPY